MTEPEQPGSAMPGQAAAVGLLALAVLLRWLAWSSIQQDWWADNPTVDAFTYLEQVRALLAGQDPFAEGLYQPPGLPWLMQAQHLLLGADEATPSIPRAFNLLFGLLTTGGVYLLGRRLHPSPWLALGAGVLYTLYPSTLLFELDLLTPPTTGLLLVLALLLYRRSWWGAGLAGLALGAAVVVHPTFLLAALALAWLLRRERAPLAAFAFAVVLMLSPTMKRNADAGHFALVSHNAGLNAYLGNNPDWKETAFLRPGVPFRQLVLQADPANRDQYQRNEYWLERTKAEASAHPGALLGALATKAVWSVNHREIPRNEDYRCRTQEGPLAWVGALPVRYGLVFPLALVGVFVCLSRRRWELPLLWASLQAPMVLFLVADRYRMATWPVLCLLAAVGGARLLQALQRRHWPVGAVALVGLVLTLAPIDPVAGFHEGWCVHQQANRLMAEEDVEGARALYEQAAELEPEQLGHWYWLGETRARTKDPEGAIEAWDHVLADFPDHYQSLIGAARESGRLGRFTEAADYQGAACEIPGPRTNTCARYVELLWKAGRKDEARAVLVQRPELRGHPKVEGLDL